MEGISMKMIFSLIVTTVLLFSLTINEQIHALENASPQKRVELMNHIKEQLISMNQEDRMKAIGTLQEKIQGNHNQNRQQHQNNMQRETKEQKHKNRDSIKCNPLEQHEIRNEQLNLSHNRRGDNIHQERQQNEERTHNRGSREYNNNRRNNRHN